MIVSGIGWVKLSTYSPSQTSDRVMTEKSEKYHIEDHPSFIKFIPTQSNLYHIVFYNGALVEAQAYAPLAAKLAQKGYTVYLLKTLLNLPILSGNQAIEVIHQERVDKVILMGHSLGGVVASQTVASHPNEVSGLVLLASYPSNSTDLSQLTLPVLSLTATQDQVLKWESYQNSQALLPPHTQYLSIEGGNHAGFGDYGAQKGDGEALISVEQQHQAIVEAIVKFFH